MAIYKVKRFSSYGKFKAGLKGLVSGAKYGAIAGAAIVPGNITALLLGKPKTSAIITGIGAGIGGITGGIYNAGKAIDSYKYDNDPEYKAKIDKENNDKLLKIIDSRTKILLSLDSKRIINSLKSFEEKYSVQFNSDLFSYIKFYEKFSKKNWKKWYESQKDLIGTSANIIVREFTEIFPNPDFGEDFKWKVEEFLESYTIGFDAPYFNVAADNISFSDSSALYYHFDSKKYGFIGDGDTKFKSISDTISKFIKAYRRLLNEEGKLAKIHNQIIDEFLIGLKQIK